MQATEMGAFSSKKHLFAFATKQVAALQNRELPPNADGLAHFLAAYHFRRQRY